PSPPHHCRLTPNTPTPSTCAGAALKRPSTLLFDRIPINMGLFDFFTKKLTPQPVPSQSRKSFANTPVNFPYFTVTLPGPWRQEPIADAVRYVSEMSREELIFGFESVSLPLERLQDTVRTQLNL